MLRIDLSGKRALVAGVADDAGYGFAIAKARDGARPDWVLDQTFDLFDRLGATNHQLDFPVIYASALIGYAGTTADVRSGDMNPLIEAIIRHVPPPSVDVEGPLQMQVSSLGYDSYVGVLGIGRVTRGTATTNTPISVVAADGSTRLARLGELYGFMGLKRVPIESADAGDIVSFSGIEDLHISDTICDRNVPEGLPALQVDEPTISMTFQVNKSPFSGKEGKYLFLLLTVLYKVAIAVREDDTAVEH